VKFGISDLVYDLGQKALRSGDEIGFYI